MKINKMETKCNHLLGILNSFNQTDENNLYLNSYVEKLYQLSETSIELAKHNMARAPIFPKSYIDKRKGFATLFNYCPYCGEKLNWKKLRQMLDF